MDLSRFWQTLLDSELIAPQVVLQLQHASTAHLSKKGEQPTQEGICAELVAKKLLSSFQAQVLLSGRSGPFQFGNYTISQPVNFDSYLSTFKARHRKTQHSVLLDFLPGHDQPDLILWRAIEAAAQKLESIDLPQLLTIYESVALPNYRFVVRQRPTGSQISQLAGRAWRLPLSDVCWIFAQLAAAIDTLHQNDSVHGGLHPASIWIAEKGLVQTGCNLIANLPAEVRYSVLAAQDRAAQDSASPAPNDNNDRIKNNPQVAFANREQLIKLAQYWRPAALPPEFLPEEELRQMTSAGRASESTGNAASQSPLNSPNQSNRDPQPIGNIRLATAAKIEWTPAADWFQFGTCLLQTIQKTAQGKIRESEFSTLPSEFSAENHTADGSELISQLRTDLPGNVDGLLDLVSQLLDKSPATRREAARSAQKMLEQQSGRSISKAKPIESPTLAPFKKTLQPFIISPDTTPALSDRPGDKLEDKPEDKPGDDSVSGKSWNTTEPQAPTETGTDTADFSPPVAIDLSEDTGSTSFQRPVSKNRNFEMGVLGVVALLFFSCLAVASWIASKQSGPAFVEGQGNDADVVAANDSTTSLPMEDSSTAEINAKLLRLANLPSSQRPIVIQELIDDDRKTLWESPTEGAALSDLSLPPAPKLIFVFRPQALLAESESELLARSLGPDFLRLKEQWQKIAGVQWSRIDRLVASLHSTPKQIYQSVLVFELDSGIDRDQLFLNWNRSAPANLGSGGSTSFVSADGKLAYRFLPPPQRGRPQGDSGTNDSSTTNDLDTIVRFAIGHPDLVDAIEVETPVEPLLGSLQALLNRSDRDRHFNFIFLRPALFNEEGQAWMGERLSGFNRELSVLIPDEILAATFSLHFDQGTYWELQLVNSVNVKIDELRALLEQRGRLVSDQLIELAGAFPSHPHWNRLKARFGVMIADLFRNARWGVEYGEIVGNGWLPPGAAHNLMAGADLALTLALELPEGLSMASSLSRLGNANDSLGSNISPSADSDRPAVPTTIKEVLAIPRDLKVTNPPDLNLLLAELQAEINDEFPSLGGRFRIKLMGPDLQLEGITQNQRPGALDIDQQPLSSILTQIMISANPSKDISGPSDPNCKLVWLVADEPHPDDPNQASQPIIMVTTRAAAQRQQYQLPPEFQLEN